VITGPRRLLCSQARLDGYRAALERVGAPADPALIKYGDFHHPSGRAAALELLELEDPPTAIFAGSDQQAFGVYEALRARGLRVALDDFGTGFASLTHLLTVPVDILKIDKSFVDRLSPTDGSTAIIAGLLDIARKLGIRVIAEGIEAADQVTQLRALGCTLGQGYHYSKAVDREVMTDLLARNAEPTLDAARTRLWREFAIDEVRRAS